MVRSTRVLIGIIVVQGLLLALLLALCFVPLDGVRCTITNMSPDTLMCPLVESRGTLRVWSALKPSDSVSGILRPPIESNGLRFEFGVDSYVLTGRIAAYLNPGTYGNVTITIQQSNTFSWAVSLAPWLFADRDERRGTGSLESVSLDKLLVPLSDAGSSR